MSPVFLLRNNIELCGRVTINSDLVEECDGLSEGILPELTRKYRGKLMKTLSQYI
jgi:hypothetical protein